ncbi:TcpQ domain-containing protein [Vibrio cholerae]|nr:TcpQ domain-containing protein [Vibrio cholerae]
MKKVVFGLLSLSLLAVPAMANEQENIDIYTEQPIEQVAAPVTVVMTLHERQLLSRSITQWAETMGFKVKWASSKDFRVFRDIELTGESVDDVLIQLANILSGPDYGLQIKLYAKNQVLVIEEW